MNESLEDRVSEARKASALTIRTEEMRDLRTRAGLTQEAMAKLVGVTRVTLSGWELGKHEPQRKHRESLAAVADVIRRQLKNEGR